MEEFFCGFSCSSLEQTHFIFFSFKLLFLHSCFVVCCLHLCLDIHVKLILVLFLFGRLCNKTERFSMKYRNLGTFFPSNQIIQTKTFHYLTSEYILAHLVLRHWVSYWVIAYCVIALWVFVNLGFAL